MTQPIGYNQIPSSSGVTIQIFNPTAGPCVHDGHCGMPATNYMTAPAYPANYYTQSFNNTNATKEASINTVTEKTVITEKEVKQNKTIEIPVPPQKKTMRLNDEYIKKLESYLDSKDVEKRILASKDILERVQEDTSRKDNVALTALTNKMLKDPYQPIRFLALGILEDRLITGNYETVETLKQVETGRYSKNGNTDQDAIKASNVLLKMTRKVQE